ncbi:MAG: type II secretion system F family protein [Pseudomonadota bacterium]
MYEIRALGGSGRCSLTLDAVDEAAARAQARSQGYQVLAVRPAGASRRLGRSQGFPLVLFTRELMALLASGLPLTESLETLAEKETRSENKEMLNRVIRHLYEGERFSAAIAHVPAAFPPLYVSVVQAAERTSDLSEALGRYVAYQEQVDGVKKKVVAAAVYPALLLVAGGLVALFLLGYVTPRFAGVYEGNLEQLPWASRLLMDWGGMIQDHGLAALVVLVAGLALAVWGLGRPAARAWLSRQVWRMPGLGERLRVFHLTRFYRTVGMLLSGGIPAVAALAMAEGLLHPELRVRLQGAARLIKEGRPISSAMEARGLSTPVASRLLRVGEKSGRMGEMMESIARFHDEELARFVDWFTRLVEPVLMALIGLVIGVIVVLLYLPIFDLAGSLE